MKDERKTQKTEKAWAPGFDLRSVAGVLPSALGSVHPSSFILHPFESELAGQVAEDAADAALVHADAGGDLLRRQPLPLEAQEFVVLGRRQCQQPLPQVVRLGLCARLRLRRRRQSSLVLGQRSLRPVVADVIDESVAGGPDQKGAEVIDADEALAALAED